MHHLKLFGLFIAFIAGVGFVFSSYILLRQIMLGMIGILATTGLVLLAIHAFKLSNQERE